MLSYVYYGTNDLLAAIAFYEVVLTPLGMSRVVTNDSAWDAVAAGWGRYDKDKKEELAFPLTAIQPLPAMAAWWPFTGKAVRL